MNTLVDLIKSNQEFTDKGFYFIYSRENEKFISYHDFYQQAVHMGNVLKKNGFKEKDELVLSTDNIESFLTVFWACILEGITVIPSKLNEDNLEQFQNVWGVCERPRVVTDVTNAKELWNVLDENVVLQYSDLAKEKDVTCEIPTYVANEEDLAYVQFSSGSSSDAKGVEIRHKMAITWQKLLKTNLMWQPTGVLSWVPLFHNYGLVAGCMTTLFLHVNCYMIQVESFFQDPILWGIILDRYKISHTLQTNFALNYFLKKFDLDETEYNWDLSHLRDIFVGAEPISSSLCREFEEKMRKFGLPDNTINPGYGLAEATLTVTMTPDNEPLHIKYVNTDSLTIGERVEEVEEDFPNHSVFMATGKRNEVTRLKIFDLNENELPENHVGIICLQGDCVFKQYYRNSHNDAFLSNGWLNTGDLGFLDQGFLYVTGRYKNMFLYNGKNYYSNDIEEFIHSENDLFRDMVYIVGYRKEPKDVNDTILCFFVYNEDFEERANALQSVIEKVHTNLGIYISEIIPIREVPKTSSGKVKRYMLKENYQDNLYSKEIELYQSMFHEEAATVETEIEDVELFLEETLVGILGENIDIGANFIDMGLKSKDISKFFIQIDTYFPNLITISELFEFQNVEQLAAHINEKYTK